MEWLIEQRAEGREQSSGKLDILVSFSCGNTKKFTHLGPRERHVHQSFGFVMDVGGGQYAGPLKQLV